MYRLALFLHVLSVLLLLGPLFAQPLARSFRGSPPAPAVLKIEEAIGRVHSLGVVVMLLTGVWLIFAADLDFAQATWLHIALLLFLAWAGVHTALLVPAQRRARQAAERGDEGQASRLLVGVDGRLVPAVATLVVLLLFLMTYKPLS